MNRNTYSLSKYSDESEYDYPYGNPSMPPIGDDEDGSPVLATVDEELAEMRLEIPETLESPFITTGELICSSDEYAWLLPAVSGGIAIKAKAQTDEVWKATASYAATMIVPDDIFHDGSRCSAEVYYPTSVRAGDTGVIAIVVKSDLGYVYCSYCQFLAGDDLQIVYGCSHPQTASGGEFDIDDNRQLSINFYTGATPEYYEHRRGFAAQYGWDGDLTVEFIDTAESEINESIQE